MRALPLDADELLGWLALSTAPGIGAALARRVLTVFGLPHHALDPSRGVRARLMGAIGALAAQVLLDTAHRCRAGLLARTLAWRARDAHHLLCLADPAYPPRLLDLPDPPVLLYVSGSLGCLHAPALAVVGSRHATPQGAENASGLARTLAEAGLVIVSGLARGIDAAAHRGALLGRAGTLVVCGTGADLVYPACHQALAEKITCHGALVTELPLGAPARRHHFPRRNRLIAAFARGVLVVEAAARSGSLITAGLANDLGREIFAIPGSIHAPQARGCHLLLKDGAKLVESAADVLIELGPPC